MTLTGIKALAFDTGGTVLDWHSGIGAALASGRPPQSAIPSCACRSMKAICCSLTAARQQSCPVSDT